MADVELVIKIPEEEYASCKEQWDTECCDILMIAVKYGTPLPKGHGRLIDVDKLKSIRPQDVEFHKVLQHSKTVVKADKESKE